MATLDNWLSKIGLTTTDRLQEIETKLADVTSRVNRAYEAGFDDGMYNGEDEPPTGTVATYGYSRSTAKGLRDFSKMSHDQIINTVWSLYQSNGIAKRALTIKRDHILGRNTKPEAVGDKALQAILDDFWKCNKLRERIKKFTLEKFLWGELCLPVFVRETDGRVKLGYIDPSDIEDVLPHPSNVLEPWMVICKLRQGESVRRVYRIVREDESYPNLKGKMIQAPNEGKLVRHSKALLQPWEKSVLRRQIGLTEYTGTCFYFSTNNVSNQIRGFSDLIQSVDSLDQHDETLFALGEREALAGYFSWDVALDTQDDSQVKKRASEIRKNPPRKKGQINVHNNSEKWELVHPDLKQPGTVATAEALKTHALNGMGQPPHWHGEDNTATRTTADSQNNPTNATLKHEQDKIRDMIIFMCEFVRDQAEIAGNWQPTPIEDDAGQLTDIMSGEIRVAMPEISVKDTSRAATVFNQIVSGLVVSHLDLEVTSRETVAKAVAVALAELGVDYDAMEELERVDQARKKQGEQNGDDLNNTLNNIVANAFANGTGNDADA